MKGPPVLIVPGWTNSGPAHWQSLWERAHPEYRRVEQQDWDEPQLEAWVAALDAAIRAAAAPPVLVAHSLGCIAVIHWVARAFHTAGDAVAAALLVAPADVQQEDLPREIRDFAPIPRVRLPFRSMLVASRTDPYLTMSRAGELARAWGAELVDVGDAGHLNTDSGYGPWPQGTALLGRLVSDSI